MAFLAIFINQHFVELCLEYTLRIIDVVIWCMIRKYVSQQIGLSPFNSLVSIFTFEVVGIGLQATEFDYSLLCHFDIWPWVNVDVPNYTFLYFCVICSPFLRCFVWWELCIILIVTHLIFNLIIGGISFYE